MAMQPRDGVELANLLYSACQWERPVVMRYPRGSCPDFRMPDRLELIPPGKAEVVREGWEVQIWALGDMVPLALAAAEALAAGGLSVGVVNARFVTPLDGELLNAQARFAKVVATVENGVVAGGFGSAVTEHLTDAGYGGRLLRFGWPKEFVPHGTPATLMEEYGLTPAVIAAKISAAIEARAQ